MLGGACGGNGGGDGESKIRGGGRSRRLTNDRTVGVGGGSYWMVIGVFLRASEVVERFLAWSARGTS